MNSVDNVLIDSFSRLFADICLADTVDEVERSGSSSAIWASLVEYGLAGAWIPESKGGVGLGLTDGMAILKMAGQYVVPAPLAETLLAQWVLAQTSLDIPADSISVAIALDAGTVQVGPGDTFSAVLEDVAYASHCGYLLLIFATVGEPVVALFKTSDLQLECQHGLAGEPRDRVMLCETHSLGRESANGDLPLSAQAFGALIRAQQMSGALESVLSQTVQYAGERAQFGRAISGFQAVQHLLAQLAGEVACAQVAAQAALNALLAHGIASEKSLAAIAAAKVRCSEAAGKSAAIAHQVHGAMGFTREYSLQQKTRRLWQWREDFGSDSIWARRLGQNVAARGGNELWQSLVEI